ncbi:hypothetical protein [Azohydromonas aeria]|uniref:hypothetical protein n=1 Tax=Azohydromonas aeria TaxID=2590212 RepID=UPI0012F98D72|nr:hypothetical protein [Azohydromonas aeria]
MAVLDGASFSAAGRLHGLSRSTAGRQVRALVRQAVAQSGPGSVDRQSVGTPHGLRQCREPVLQALATFEPAARHQRRRWEPDAHQIAEGAQRLKELSRTGARDVALLYVLFTTGLKPLELARLAVGDYLQADGSIRRHSTLRPEASVNARPRPLLFVSQRACDALDDYLRQRLQRRHGLGGSAGAYRGLDPSSPLFLTEDGHRFELRRRACADARTTCRLMCATFHAIFERAGWPGLTTQEVRRMVARRLVGMGTSPAEAAQLLGLASAAGLRRLVGPREAVELGRAVAALA